MKTLEIRMSATVVVEDKVMIGGIEVNHWLLETIKGNLQHALYTSNTPLIIDKFELQVSPSE